MNRRTLKQLALVVAIVVGTGLLAYELLDPESGIVGSLPIPAGTTVRIGVAGGWVAFTVPVNTSMAYRVTGAWSATAPTWVSLSARPLDEIILHCPYGGCPAPPYLKADSMNVVLLGTLVVLPESMPPCYNTSYLSQVLTNGTATFYVNFDATGGDTVTVTQTFQVEAIPLPVCS